MKLKIEDLAARAPHKPEGKEYTVYSWIISGTVDGAKIEGMDLSTLSGRVAGQIKAGWEGDVERTEWRGETQYRIPTPKPLGMLFGKGAPRGEAVQYSWNEYWTLYAEAWAQMMRVAPKDAAPELLGTMFGTAFIGAQRAGLKVPDRSPDQEPSENAPF